MKFRIIPLLIFSVLGIWISLVGYDYWLNYKNYGTFTGNVAIAEKYNFRFQTSECNTLSLKDYQGKYLIVDCCYTYCGVCYKTIPCVQDLYNQYQNNSELKIYSLHCRIEKEEGCDKGQEILRERGYEMFCLSINIEDSVLRKQLRVEVFPIVLVFDKESNLIFRGNLDRAVKLIDDLIEND